jgi:uncharacterized protein (TIGR03083 family)
MNVTQLAAAERRELADYLETLNPEQWQAPSLCAEWTVHDVAAHVTSYDVLSWPETARRAVKGRLTGRRGPDGSNALGVEASRRRSPEELVALLREHAEPRGVTALFGGAIALTDGVIHQQDIRRPLGDPRDIPHDRLRTALSFSLRAPVLPSRRNARGLRLVATDVGWTHGEGAEVRGPGEALLMAVAGRTVALPELSGAGVETLRDRVTDEADRSSYAVSMSRLVAAPPEAAFECVRLVSLPEMFDRRSGPIPAVREIRDREGDWSSPGEARTLVLADGGRLRQRLTRLDPPHGIDYTINDVRGPMRPFVTSVEGRWRFEDERGAASPGTRVTWAWTFHATNATTARLLPAIGRFWRGYARHGLDRLERMVR